jgi:inward rectifier potassium channel
MRAASFDPGLTQQYNARLRRAINKDGTFNVYRRGMTWRDVHPYLHLINMPWWAFLTTVVCTYIVVNTAFAGVYLLIGTGELQGGDNSTALTRFLSAFYFSAETLTTVGYGNIAPHGHAAWMVAAFEAMLGWLGLALATGLLFGRVSRPSARIGFSEHAVIAPYDDGVSLQFRIVNKRRNSLMELEATVMLMTVEGPVGELTRRYKILKLERQKVYFFPLTWTVLHPIDTESPLFGVNAKDLERLQAELLILIKAWDDTFSQTVHQRYSYRYDEIVWNARFTRAFRINEEGDIELDVHRVGEHAPV